MEEQLKQQIQEAIDKYKKEHGDSFEVQADYTDYLDTTTIAKIFEDEKPLSAFYNVINEGEWYESADQEYVYILNDLLDLPQEIKEEYSDDILQMLQDQIAYELPYEHYNQTVGFDVFLNNPEASNTGYQEDLLQFDETEDADVKTVIGLGSEISKLVQLQGYKDEDFIAYVNNEGNENSFFKSLLNEIENCTYDYGNQIVFLVQAPIMDMAKAIEQKANITIPADAQCGLVETGDGSGSVMGITLNTSMSGDITDMTKPSYQAREGIFAPRYNEGYSYNIKDIYGMSNSAWDADVKINNVKIESLNLAPNMDIKSINECLTSLLEDAKLVYPKGQEITKAQAKKLAQQGKSFIVALAKDPGIAYRITDFEDMMNSNKQKQLDKKPDFVDNFKNMVNLNFDRLTKYNFEGNNKLIYFNESKINEISDKLAGDVLGKRIAAARQATKHFQTEYPNQQITIDKNDPRAEQWLKDSDEVMDLTSKARKTYRKVVYDRNNK